jgi:hypothetical protein
MKEGIRSNMDVVVYALGVLGGGKRKVSTEAIADQSYQLAPDRFSWVLTQYKQFPDKDVARVALEDAKKPHYGGLVDGNYSRETSKDGWTLTPAGIRWLAENQDRIRLALGRDQPPDLRLSPMEARRFGAQLRRASAFQLYSTTGSVAGISRFMLSDMLQCSPDAPTDLLRFKFDRLLSQAELANDGELKLFLSECEQRFADLFGGREEEGDGEET